MKTPLAVWGPAGLEDYWHAFLTSMEADIDLRQSDEGRPELAGLVRINTIEEVSFYSKDGLSVTAMRNVHPPLVDTFALSFRTRNRHVVFSGCLLYTSPSPRDLSTSRMPSSA